MKNSASKRIKNNILALGDSHIRVFEHFFFKYLLPQYAFNVTYVPGATAYGIGNVQSKTGAYSKFLESLALNNYEKIVVTLGEVDCAYTLWSHTQRTKEPIDIFLDRSIERYTDFVKMLTAYAPVTVMSVPLPTVDDFTECDDSVSGIRKTPSVSLEERTSITHKFNNKIKESTEKILYASFIDLSPLVSEKKTGKLKFMFKNRQNPCDHHYKRWMYALLVIWKVYILR